MREDIIPGDELRLSILRGDLARCDFREIRLQQRPTLFPAGLQGDLARVDAYGSCSGGDERTHQHAVIAAEFHGQFARRLGLLDNLRRHGGKVLPQRAGDARGVGGAS